MNPTLVMMFVLMIEIEISDVFGLLAKKEKKG